MADIEISDLTLKVTPVGSDELEIQETGGGESRKATVSDVVSEVNVTAAGALMDTEVSANLKTFELPASTTISAFIKTLLDNADAATARVTLGALAEIGGQLTDYAETFLKTTGVTGTKTIDLSLGNDQKYVLTGDTTISCPDDPGTNKTKTFVLTMMNEDGTAVPTISLTGPTAVWMNNEPTFTLVSGKVNVITGKWDDDDSRWLLFDGGQEA